MMNLVQIEQHQGWAEIISLNSRRVDFAWAGDRISRI